MTKTEKMLALRKWFNPDNYDALLDLTVEELRQEFRYRQNMFYSLETAIERQRENLNYKEEKLIFSGQPVLTASLGENKLSVGEHNLESDQHVRLFPVGWLYQLMDVIRRSKIVPLDEFGRPESDSPYNRYPASWFWGKLHESQKGRMILHINLRGSTDDEILESMRYLLPKWRKATGVKLIDGKLALNFGEVMIKKLVDFRIIPLLDLLYWSGRNEIKLSDAELSALIYRVGIDAVRGDSQIKETDKPMALKAKTYHFDNQFMAFLYKNRYMMDMKVSAIVDKLNQEQEEREEKRKSRGKG
ncbi:DUF6387 family protein [Pantoea dispersa]